MRRKEKEINEISEIENVIRSAEVCRIAFANDNEPYIVIMNFGYSGGSEKKLYFHSAMEGKKLDMIRKNNYVCFEFDIDHNLRKGSAACDFSMSYRSVIGWGRIAIISDDYEKSRGLDTIMSHYSNEKEFLYDKMNLDRMLILRLDIQKMTGKKCI
jgi:uncharacterized protein